MLPGFKKMADELTQKADRFENQSFTVALFGAFSAGKSSFANALIGERFYLFHRIRQLLLSIKSCLIDAEHPHGMVLVKLKSIDTLMGDVNRSLAAFDKNAERLKVPFRMLNKYFHQNRNVDAYEKIHLAFLQAFVTWNWCLSRSAWRND